MSYETEVNRWVEENKSEILLHLSELIRIRTENVPPHGNERNGQEYLYDLFSRLIPAAEFDLFEIDEVSGIRENSFYFPTVDGIQKDYRGRPNLVAKLTGTSKGNSIVFSGHIDTMSAEGEKWTIVRDPFSGKLVGGKMYGRGSCDMKAGVIAGFFALKCLYDLKVRLKGDVFAESVIDEEYGGVNGTIACRLRNPGIDFAILAEPTGLTAGIETTGGTDFKISVRGSGVGGLDSARAGQANPLYKLGRIVLALEKYEKVRNERLRIPDTFKSKKVLHLWTYQVFSGGSRYIESQSIPTSGHIYLWLEMFSYMNGEEEKKRMKKFIERELEGYQEGKEFSVEIDNVIRFMSGHRTDVIHPGLTSLKGSCAILGIPYRQEGLGLTCDAFTFKPVGNTEVVVFGPRGGNIHGIDEYVEVESVFDLIRVMVCTAIDYCG